MLRAFSLEGRTALVTGGSRGIGRMIAEGFIAQGARVYITARKAEAAHRAAEEMSHGGGPCVAIPQDISTTEGARALATEICRREDGRLDILVNNAGTSWDAGFDAFPEKGWDKVLDLNLKTPFFLTQYLHDALKAAATKERPAKVINVSSIDGIALNPQDSYSYHASKAGLEHLTRRLATRLAPDHIRVNSIAPGAFASELNQIARDHADLIAAHIPAGRIGEPEDMASAAIYLAARSGDYLMGCTLVIDGGVALPTLPQAPSA